MSAELTLRVPQAKPTQDYLGDAVPASARKGPVFMGLLWVTMVTGFATLKSGFDFHQAGLTLAQTLEGTVVGSLLLLAYTMFAAFLGSSTGQTYAMLTRAIYGRVGSWLVSLLVSAVSLGWYGFQAALLALLLDPFLHLGPNIVWLAAGLATLMGVSNYFGFTGVAGYARWVAAPLMLVWVSSTVWRAFSSTPPAVLWGVPPQAAHPTLSVVALAGVTIGYGVWGNEPDFWRFGKARFWLPAVPVAIAFAVGLVLFPLAGWVLGAISGATSLPDAVRFVTRYALGGLSSVAMVIFLITACANNDPNLYEAVNALQNVTRWPRRPLVLSLWPLGVLSAVVLVRVSDAFSLIATAASVLMPVATVVMATDAFLLPRLGLVRRLDRVVPWSEVKRTNWPAVAATLVGVGVGLATNGTFPQLGPGWGIPSLQAWAAATVAYLALAVALRDRPDVLALEVAAPADASLV